MKDEEQTVRAAETDWHKLRADIEKIVTGLVWMWESKRREYIPDSAQTDIDNIMRAVDEFYDKRSNARIVSVLEELKASKEREYFDEVEMKMKTGKYMPVSLIDAAIAAHKQKEQS